MIRVLVVDDHAVVRGGLEQLIATATDMELVATAVNGAEAVARAGDSAPDVILMDLSMPVLDGIAATHQIMAFDPEARVIVLTSFSDDRRILDALAAGATGYLLKHAGPDELLGAIRAAATGGAPLDPKAARVMLDSRRPRRAADGLTGREQEVLRLVVAGLANKQIGRRLGIAERTVKSHLGHIFERLGVTDRTQAALWAKEHLPEDPGGVLPP
jgi:DNA-binding NarL/FixJ family response regulator